MSRGESVYLAPYYNGTTEPTDARRAAPEWINVVVVTFKSNGSLSIAINTFF